MTNYERNKRNSTTGAFIKYCHNKAKYQRTTFRIRGDGSTCWLLDGKEIDDKEFRDMHPIGLINKVAGVRIDSRQNIF